jgi:hypothetical protein
MARRSSPVEDAAPAARISSRSIPLAERPDARAFARNASHSASGTDRIVTDVTGVSLAEVMHPP